VSFGYWRNQNLTSALKPLGANSNLAVSSSSSAALTADKGETKMQVAHARAGT
tara:strand:+ start:46 stop:204 length:159 start_codon:yes stop_codon:yes gene_type:complete